MQITIDWQEPIQLTRNKKLLMNYNSGIPDAIGSIPGVYFFSRRYGEEYQPFYIGETTNIRKRLIAHLKDVKIVDTLRGTRTR